MTEEIQQPFFVRYKWLLPLILALIIVAVVLGFVLAAQAKNGSKKGHHHTPTVVPTKPVHTKTVPTKPAPTTPVPTKPPPTRPAPTKRPTPTRTHATPTPTPSPTATPTPSPTASTAPRTGIITQPKSQIQHIQTAATQGQSAYTVYLNPYQAVKTTLKNYGFTGTYTFVSPAPTATPTATPFTNSSGQPTIKVVISYQGQQFTITVSQLAKHGTGGIWLIVNIQHS